MSIYTGISVVGYSEGVMRGPCAFAVKPGKPAFDAPIFTLPLHRHPHLPQRIHSHLAAPVPQLVSVLYGGFDFLAGAVLEGVFVLS
jgi:hypothetical protein